MEFRQNSAEISSKNRRFFDKNCEICQCVYLLPLSTGQEHVGCRRKQSLFVDSTADELSQHRILRNKSFVDLTEEQQGREDLLEFFEALHPFGNCLEKLRRCRIHHRKLVSKRGIKLKICLVFKRCNIAVLSPHDIRPHGDRQRRIGSAEFVITHCAPHQAEPASVKYFCALESHIAPCRNIELKGLRVGVCDH